MIKGKISLPEKFRKKEIGELHFGQDISPLLLPPRLSPPPVARGIRRGEDIAILLLLQIVGQKIFRNNHRNFTINFPI